MKMMWTMLIMMMTMRMKRAINMMTTLKVLLQLSPMEETTIKQLVIVFKRANQFTKEEIIMMGMQEDSKLYHQGKGNKAPEEGVTDSKINNIRQVLVRV